MLEQPKKEITYLHGKSFLNMRNLRLLKINNVDFSEDLEYLSNELRFLKWHGYPLNSLPSSFHPEKLFKLNLCYSRVEHLWNGIKSLEKLKIIKLSHSYNLIRTPDFTEVPNLERLDLEGCTSLIEVHESVGFLKKLIVLNLKNCKNLVSFPSNVCGLTSLKILNLYGCSILEKLPQNIGEVEYLEELDVSGTAIKQLPSSIVLLTNLKTLFLHGCKGKQHKTWASFFWSLFLPKRYRDSMCLSLPNFTGLSSLTNLDLSDCNLFERAIPDDLGSLFSLQALDLSRNNFVNLPASINQLSKLRSLRVDKCQRLESLPELPLGIIYVGAEDCTSLERLSGQLKPSTSANILFHFFNCFKLVENQGRNNSLGVLLLKLRLQELSNHSAQFHIRLPGSEIPEWFRHWSNGCSIELQLPPHWYNDNFMGFVVCAVLALPHYPDEVYEQILCSFDIKGVVSFSFRFLTPSSSTAESDHLWLGYMSHTEFKGIQEWEGTCRVIKARFQVVGQGEKLWGVSVKRCAIRLLYKQEVENFEFGYNNFEELPAIEGPMINECGYSEELIPSGSEDSYDDPRLNSRRNFLSWENLYDCVYNDRDGHIEYYDCEYDNRDDEHMEFYDCYNGLRNSNDGGETHRVWEDFIDSGFNQQEGSSGSQESL